MKLTYNLREIDNRRFRGVDLYRLDSVFHACGGFVHFTFADDLAIKEIIYSITSKPILFKYS
jgi:hypothetical protein